MIVIPMAGLSSRFAREGYAAPKYMLPLGSETVFDHAVRSFHRYRDRIPFLFVVRDIGGTVAFVRERCAALEIEDARVITLEAATAGQAETVAVGIDQAQVGGGEPLTIFNIDTFRPDFRFDEDMLGPDVDGYLEVFEGSGANWSYVRPNPADPRAVLETAEKKPISNLCCTGLYHFARASDFRFALATEREDPGSGELYVAPLYNHLIARGRRILYDRIGRLDVVFCGVPDEYRGLGGAAPAVQL